MAQDDGGAVKCHKTSLCVTPIVQKSKKWLDLTTHVLLAFGTCEEINVHFE